MSQSIIGQENVQPYKFSECSRSDYIDALRIGHGLCLLNKPNEVTHVIYFIIFLNTFSTVFFLSNSLRLEGIAEMESLRKEKTAIVDHLMIVAKETNAAIQSHVSLLKKLNVHLVLAAIIAL